MRTRPRRIKVCVAPKFSHKGLGYCHIPVEGAILTLNVAFDKESKPTY